MKHWVALATALFLAMQPCLAFAQTKPAISGPDTRLYLADGNVVMGHLVKEAEDMFIMKIDNKVFTFEREQVEKIVTIESLGSTAQTITVTEFPYISFLGGTLAFGVLSGLLFDRASDKETEADQNEQMEETRARAASLRDEADTARLLGWGSALVAAGTLGVSLLPRKSTRRIFPELSFEQGTSKLKITYVF